MRWFRQSAVPLSLVMIGAYLWMRPVAFRDVRLRIHTVQRRLVHWANGRLTTAATNEARELIFARLDGRRAFDFSYPESIYTWNLRSNGSEERTLLLALCPTAMHPGASSLFFGILDRHGHIVGAFPTGAGWRLFPNKAELRDVPGVGSPVIVISNGSGFGGEYAGRFYYTLIDDEIALLRLEDEGGRAWRNPYLWDSHTIGPSPRQRTAKEWETLLFSSRSECVLQTLVWLGGMHRDPKERYESELGIESKEDAELANAVRGRPKVQEVLRKLIASQNPWMREQAQLAMVPKYYKYD